MNCLTYWVNTKHLVMIACQFRSLLKLSFSIFQQETNKNHGQHIFLKEIIFEAYASVPISANEDG